MLRRRKRLKQSVARDNMKTPRSQLNALPCLMVNKFIPRSYRDQFRPGGFFFSAVNDFMSRLDKWAEVRQTQLRQDHAAQSCRGPFTSVRVALRIKVSPAPIKTDQHPTAH